MADDKNPQATAAAGEPDFSWRWHLKVLSIIYLVLAVAYTAMLALLAEPDFKWSSQAFYLVVLYALPAVLWGIRTWLLAREKKTA
jgi:membrane protein YdbS with pleckstrin-like domain